MAKINKLNWQWFVQDQDGKKDAISCIEGMIIGEAVQAIQFEMQ